MGYRVGKIYAIGVSNETYNFVKYHHQSGHPSKSWWISSLDDEASLFIGMTNEKYISSDGENGYNIDAFNKKPAVIGRDIRGQEFYLAKFKFNKINWHGYPANHMIAKDRPEDEVLSKMKKDGIHPGIYRKIKKGQKI